MIAALQLVQRRVLTQPELFHSFDISIVDIDQHSALESAWGDKVPVLLIANAVDDLKRDAAVEVGHAATNGAINNTKTEICHYFLDENALLASLSTTFQ